jgi:ABC-type multidrug transport system ATPase subunit
LLPTLAGRMRPGGGEAVVFGHPLPRRAARVRGLSALGPVPGVNDLEQSLSVGEHLRERRWLHRGTRRPAEVLAEVGLAELQPRTLVRDLDELDAFRLGTALALLGRPRLLAVDDVPDRPEAWQLLHAVAEREDGPLVLAATLDVPGLPAETVVPLAHDKESARA